MTDVNTNLQMASRPPTRKRHKPAGNPPATPRTSRTHNRSRSASPSPAKSMSSRRRSPAPTADRNHHAESPKNPESPTPESIVPSIPFTRRCRIHRTTSPVRKVVGLSNRYGNDGREYYVCPHPGCRSFVGWNDQIGVEDGNVKCYCGLPSRKQPGKSGIFFSCANPRRNCEYYEEEDDGPRGYFCSMILGHDGGDFDDFGDSNGDGDYYGEGYLNDMARNACCDGQYGGLSSLMDHGELGGDYIYEEDEEEGEEGDGYEVYEEDKEGDEGYETDHLDDGDDGDDDDDDDESD